MLNLKGVPGFDEFYHHMGKAVEILRSYGGVVTDDYYFPHMTVQCKGPVSSTMSLIIPLPL